MSSTDWNPIPEDIRNNALMVIAWRDCLLWAIGFRPILDEFGLSSGGPLKLARGGIAFMIDKATGLQDAEFRRFIDWFNENVWGPINDPEIVAGLEKDNSCHT
jgi:hypothetical protein